MKKVELFITPYARENEIKTRLIVDGRKIDSKDNRLTNLVVYQPMRKWLNPYKRKLFVWEGFLAEIMEEFNDKSIQLVFHGCKADFGIFRNSILLQRTKLNRNGGGCEVCIEFCDSLHYKDTVTELLDILDELRIEADNRGEDPIINEIDPLKNELLCPKADLRDEFVQAPEELIRCLTRQGVTIDSQARLTVIPFDRNSDPSAIIAMLNGDTLRSYLILNTLTKENSELFAEIISYTDKNGMGIRYIENDGEDYLAEVKKVYYIDMLPDFVRRTTDILHMFPDHSTNSYLLDISYRIDDLFRQL